jgi:hypothetical protein
VCKLLREKGVILKIVDLPDDVIARQQSLQQVIEVAYARAYFQVRPPPLVVRQINIQDCGPAHKTTAGFGYRTVGD